jgi:hypothetical protein
MKNRRFLLGTGALVIALVVSGCTHRLLPDQGDRAVRVYQDEDVYKAIQEDLDKIRDPKVDPNVKKYLGMVVGLAGGESRDVDGGTKVKITSSDDIGYMIEVEEGQYLGYKGFIVKANLR